MSYFVTVVAIMTPAPGKTEILRQELLTMAKKVDEDEHGAMRYEIGETTNDAGELQFVVVEERSYADENSYQRHNNSEHFAAINRAIQENQLLAYGEIKKLRRIGGFYTR